MNKQFFAVSEEGKYYLIAKCIKNYDDSICKKGDPYNNWNLRTFEAIIQLKLLPWPKYDRLFLCN